MTKLPQSGSMTSMIVPSRGAVLMSRQSIFLSLRLVTSRHRSDDFRRIDIAGRGGAHRLVRPMARFVASIILAACSSYPRMSAFANQPIIQSSSIGSPFSFL